MKKIQVCVMHRSGPSSSCGAKGSQQLLQRLVAEVEARNLPCKVEPINCLLYCQHGPNVRLLPDGKVWHQVDARVCEQILERVRETF